MAATHQMMPQDVAYVRSKGVFSVPSEPVCEALLKAYFHHIHPILPVVDAVAVLTTFRNGGASAINLLLLWSMFSVAASVSRTPPRDNASVLIRCYSTLIRRWYTKRGISPTRR